MSLHQINKLCPSKKAIAKMHNEKTTRRMGEKALQAFH
jgi:hypothetical protein